VFNVLKANYLLENDRTLQRITKILSSFIGSYEKYTLIFRDTFGWSAKVEGRVTYHSASILNIEIKHYTYTGGAWLQSVYPYLIQIQEDHFNKKLFKDLEVLGGFC
jgi:hypothetical protein